MVAIILLCGLSLTLGGLLVLWSAALMLLLLLLCLLLFCAGPRTCSWRAACVASTDDARAARHAQLHAWQAGAAAGACIWGMGG
jgi:predicted MFS family arabinose efflux permease